MTDAAADLVALAAGALAEITDPASVGALVDAVAREPGVIDLQFECLAPGYVGWRWTVSTARLDDAEPTVLETELLPSDGALLAPPWVPWAERLAEYRRQHAEEHGADEDDDEENLDHDGEEQDDLDDDELDELDEDDDQDDQDDLDEDAADPLDDADDEIDFEGVDVESVADGPAAPKADPAR